MADIEMLPLPEADGFMEAFDTYGCPVGSEDAWGEETVKETIRANVAHATAAKDAEIEALRAEVAWQKRVTSAHAELHGEAKERAERLAEALREVDKQLDDVEPYADARAVERCHETIRAALDQERKDG